ncbi:hypothetical protein NUW54_g3516 [Trametes sanguinea]|uniref:Uncharacterized protein n=1 Tax=Trametes sanguinea TaxID=158606 RepID=A0ACC1Q1N3_9APHY|nr:hypothetical protein NUW54_g3516 [Trametes sanguinea]
MSTPVVIFDDDELLLQWHEDDWIKQEKTYPARDVPPVILAARRRILAVPPGHGLLLLPAPELSVTALLQTDLPSQPPRLVFEQASTAFSHDLPTEDLSTESFRLRPIPPLPYLKQLEAAFGQAWFDGAKSVTDFRYKQSRLPLWVLTYWREMSRTLEKRQLWRQASAWLSNSVKGQEASRELAGQAEGLFDRLAWGVDLRVLGAATTTETLSMLLSDKWLDDEMIDMLVTDIANRALGIPSISATTVVTTLAFQHSTLKVRLMEGAKKRLFFPANIDNCHWIAFCIDFESETISYGDSQHAVQNRVKPTRSITQLVNALKAWACQEMGSTLRDIGNSLAHGLQRDSSSCGICTINTLAHNIFGPGVPLFVQPKARHLRLEAFIMVAKAHLALKKGRTPSRAHESDSQEDSLSSELLGSPAHPQLYADKEQPESLEPLVSASVPPSTSESELHDVAGHSVNVYTSTPSPCVSYSPPQTDINGRSDRDTKPTIKKSPEESEGSDDVDDADNTDKEVGHAGRTAGSSRSAREARQMKEMLATGSFKVDDMKLNRFIEKLRVLDPAVEIRQDEKRRWQTWHSRCATWYTMKGPYSATRFHAHVKACDGKQSGDKRTRPAAQRSETELSTARTSTLDRWASQLGWKKVSSNTVVKLEDDASRGEGRGEEVTSEDDEHDDNVKEVNPLYQRAHETSRFFPGSSGASRHRQPCTGITDKVDERVSTYLRRAFVSGGGSKSITAISEELFKLPYRELSKRQKKAVDAAQLQHRTWRNDHLTTSVWSVTCKQFVNTDSSRRAGPLLCHDCRMLLDAPAFKTALRNGVKKASDTVKLKHLNKKYRSETLSHLFARSHGLEAIVMTEDPDASAYARLATGLLDGRLSGYPVIGDMMKALAELLDREDRGVGRQNFHYGPSLVEFANMCAITSPELYRILSQYFPLPTIRHLNFRHRRTQNTAPKFPLTVCSYTFSNVLAYLKKLGYKGPVALSCDDTKLLAAFRTYWDASQDCHMLIGGTDQPRAVANAEELQAALSDPEIKEATKIRLWCLQVPLPKIPPIIVAAKAIPNTLSVSDLHALIEPILRGLLERGVATTDKLHTISHPLGSTFPPLTVTIAFYQQNPIVMIQDSKHALKTFRNNLFSGARLLVLGNDVAMYGWARLLAFLEDSPLYNRDIEKIDRQDDNAATRLFSATTLEYLTTNHPERVGMIVYLFVMGELVDAYQSRHIFHLERVKMALRARFFLETWRAYLKAAGYAESRYFISREAANIANILIEGLLGLIFVHRDHLNSSSSDSIPFPLLPWLHSSEICEHVFAECRKLVKDFTYLDFLYMVPRLHVLLRSVINLARATDPKARAAGYAHSYYDTRNINLAQLAVFPSDADIDSAAQDAWEEAHSLFSLLGLVPSDFLPDSSKPPQSPPSPGSSGPLPSISSWFPTEPNTISHLGTAPATSDVPLSRLPSDASDLRVLKPDGGGDDGESDISSDEEEDWVLDEAGPATELQQLIHEHRQRWGSRSHHDDEQFLNLTCAAAALSMNDSMVAQRAADVPAEELDDLHNQAREDIQAAFNAASLNLLHSLPAEETRPFDRPAFSEDRADYSSLIQTRQGHETARAAQSTRVGKSSGSGKGESHTFIPVDIASSLVYLL